LLLVRFGMIDKAGKGVTHCRGAARRSALPMVKMSGPSSGTVMGPSLG
jgi:hypothetical protein